MKFICIYTDLNNPANRSKAIVEADEIEIIDSDTEGGSTLISLVKKLPKTEKKLVVFIIQEYRIVELYAADYVEVSEISKNKIQKKINDNNLVALHKID